jgi:hypothetical protein
LVIGAMVFEEEENWRDIEESLVVASLGYDG